MILLDTHAWLWWLSVPAQLPPKTLAVVEASVVDEGVYVSSFSVWELAMLAALGRLALAKPVRQWLHDAEALSYVHFVPVDNAIAVEAVNLPPPIHKDPADRIIVATARLSGATLVTRDRKLLDYPHVHTLWE